MSSVWRASAACLDADPAQFDPVSSKVVTDRSRRRAEAAIAEYCDQCPVIAECLADALRTNVTGVRGGRFIAPEYPSVSA